MKNMKLATSILLIIALVLSIGVLALAVETGSLTVNNPIAKKSYYVYRLFDLESYDKESNAYSYYLNDAWSDFINAPDVENYLTFNNTGEKIYVEWVENADVGEFAKFALAWAKGNGIEPVDGITPMTDESIVFNNLPLGYYMIDSSVGALCALTTLDPDAVVEEKNDLTTLEKVVKEDSTGDYGKENSAQIGDIVSFKSEVTVGAGAENLVVHDEMNHYLSLKTDSIKVYIKDVEVDSSNYSLETAGVDEAHVYHSLDDNCTFEISFDNDFIASLTKGTILQIQYDAVLGYDGKLWKTLNNTSWVTFGDDLKSTESTTTTNVYSVDLLKVNDEKTIIQTAKFYLYDAQTGGNVIKVKLLSEDTVGGIYKYAVASAEDEVSGNGDVIKAGYAIIYGLDKQVYYLEEIEQPTGYNKLAQRVEVDISHGDIIADLDDVFTELKGNAVGGDATDAGGLQVINKTGTVLPSTGGIGTKVIYALGGLLVAGAGVLLITKKRMGKDRH